MKKLEFEALEILSEIFELTRFVENGIDASSYRAKHDNSLDLLDQLEQNGFLIKKEYQYRLSLTGLVALKNKNTQIQFENFEKIFFKLKEYYKANQKDVLKLNILSEWVALPLNDVRECLNYMKEASCYGAMSNSFWDDEAFVKPSEWILKYKTFQEIISQLQKSQDKRISEQNKNNKNRQFRGFFTTKENDIWAEIEKDYGVSKRGYSRKLYFVSDKFKRQIIFRDVEQAYKLSVTGFSKPAVILAGSIIEELLRIYLEYKKIKPAKNTFDEYIKVCNENGFLKKAIHGLTDSVRHFRNIVHLEKESLKKHTISKATAKGAVSHIFTIINDL